MPFVSCPSCSCAVKSIETTCPHCGIRIRSSDGTIAKPLAYALLGLVGVAGCSPGPQATKYGVPATNGVEEPPPAVTADPTTTTTATTAPEPEPEHNLAPKYGVPATGGVE